MLTEVVLTESGMVTPAALFVYTGGGGVQWGVPGKVEGSAKYKWPVSGSDLGLLAFYHFL